MEDTPDYEQMKRERRERKERNRQKNMEALSNAGFPFTPKNDGTVLLFRIDGKPAVDFYPTTNRWRIVGTNSKTMYGPAKRFIGWFHAQRLPKQEHINETIQPHYTDWKEVRRVAIATKKTVVPVSGGWVLK